MSVHERLLPAMGGEAHVVVVGGGGRRLLGRAARLLDGLERRWSRFRPASEVAMLTACAGRAVPVAAETALLVGLAVEGWRRTGGRFDPTLLAAVRAAGYTTTFTALAPGAPCRPPPPPAPAACGRIHLDRAAGTVTLPTGTGFDAGGLGKGLAADLAVAALLEAGAEGACVGVGGDVRVGGTPPDGRSWRVGLPEELGGGQVGLRGGALATSSRLVRAWATAGGAAHHLIDATTARPAVVPTTTATVVAGSGWEADVLATAALLAGPGEGRALLTGRRAEGWWADAGGRVAATEGLGCRWSS